MKKVLAWAVALALVLSSFTMAFAADAPNSSQFSDADQINYTEAVDVMVATGIINGFPDGTFGPQKTVTRGQMAKMIACIMNGGEDIGDQYKSACPFADSKNHWAAGYIAYCASEHIIDGRSADKFDPDAEVTGTEVAKMALTSLGYDSQIQGYVGENWAAAVLKDAKKNNLFKDLDKSFVPGDPCDRESAAQILFNMLKATEVEYDSSAVVTTGDGTTVTVASSVKPVTKKVTDPNDSTKTIEVEVPLYEDVFGGDLVLDSAKGDDFGNPGHSWTYDEDAVGTYLDSADYEFVAEGAGFAAALEAYDEDLADAYNANPKEIAVKSVTVNGVENKAVADVCLGDTVKMYKADAAPATGTEGTDADTVWYDVVVEQYEAYMIKEVNTEDISAKEAKKGVTALVTFQKNGTAVADLTKVKNTEIAGYSDSYAKDAVVAIALKGNKIIDSYVMDELVNGKVTKTYTGKNDVMIDGTKYDAATKFNAVDGATPFAIDSEYTLYDYNGYALASTLTKPADPEVFYGIFLAEGYKANEEIWYGPGEGNNYTEMIKIFTAEGENKVFDLAEDFTIYDVNGAVIDEEATPLDPVGNGTLITYTLNEDGELATMKFSNVATGMTDKAMANGGVLYGREVAEDVVAFANISTDSNKPEWVVYDFEDLEAADKVNINAYIDKEADLVAIYCVSLEPAPKDVYGFVTGATSVTNTTGSAYEINAFVDGAETTLTTVGSKKNATDVDALATLYQATQEPGFVTEYVKFTFEGDLVKAVTVAKCVGVTKADAEFNGADAVFYGTAGSTSALQNVYKVIGTSGNSLNVGTNDATDNDFQACTGATVFSVDNGKVALSSLDKIAKDNYVILMKTDKDASTWNVVLFSKTVPDGGVVVNLP